MVKAFNTMSAEHLRDDDHFGAEEMIFDILSPPTTGRGD
jgi:hypothetical protein